MTEIIDVGRAQRLLDAAPLHRSLGLRIVGLDASGLRLEAEVTDDWLNGSPEAVAHGGLIATVLDTAADWSLLSRGLPPGPTIEFQVHYLRPVLPGPVAISGHVVRPGRRWTVAESEIHSGGKLAAIGRGTYVTREQH